jgi:hypothetical protein
MGVAPTQVTYSAENVTRAVDLLLGILERCRDKPKPVAQKWSQDMRGAIDELIGRRGDPSTTQRTTAHLDLKAHGGDGAAAAG